MSLPRKNKITRKLNKNPTQGCLPHMIGRADFINKINTNALGAHGDFVAVTFYGARTCHCILMTLCHYVNVIV